MRNRILKILSSLLLVSSISLNFVGCSSQSQQEEHNRVSRKPQVSIGGTSDSETQTESLYTHGEIITLADGSKLKYDENGNHEIVEQGEGKVIIFKTVTQDELDSLEPNQKSLVERQMQSDPNGFSLIY